MSHIKLNKEQTARIVDQLQNYFTEKLEHDIGRFEAEFLLDFFSEEIGVYFYNQALADTQQLLDSQFESMSDKILDLQKWTP